MLVPLVYEVTVEPVGTFVPVTPCPADKLPMPIMFAGSSVMFNVVNPAPPLQLAAVPVATV